MSEAKNKVISRLLNGDTPKEIADSGEVKYATVLRYNRELKEAQEAGTVAELIDMDKSVFDQVIQEIADNTPANLLDETKESLADLSEAKYKAEALQTDLQQTAAILNGRIRSMTLLAVNIGELDMLAEALCKLQNAFFNKNTTLVKVDNNYDSSNRQYNSFLGDAPAGLPNVVN